MERPMFSEMLADRRRQLGYSIRQASRVLRLREDVLIAFEEGDFEQMPKSGYAQGMISSYARYLGLDANEVVEAYTADLESYRRGSRRERGSQRGRGQRRGARPSTSGATQPYVGSRGLLPTSGGPAGDMGSFATTRVHVRNDPDSGSNEDRQERPSSARRPYTSRTAIPSRRTYRSSAATRDRQDIQTMPVDGYDDDMRLERSATPYESASTRSGRRSSRNISTSERPRVSRRSRRAPDSARGGSSARSGGRRQGGTGGLLGDGGLRVGVIAVVAVVLILSFVLIFSVVSCVGQSTESVRTVPVSDAEEQTQTQTQTDAQESDGSSAPPASTQSITSDDEEGKAQEETSVSVSVADGMVTWLEVECDGKSDVAETITGPWQKTYTVEDVITIQAGDTTAVSVVQNGRQVQFESMASGIGSISIQGTKRTSSSKSDSSGEGGSASDGTSSSARTGNASSASSSDDEDAAYESEGDGSQYDDSYDLEYS